MSAYAFTPYERRYRRAVSDLLFYSRLTHVHLDWYDPEDWLNQTTTISRLIWRDDDLLGIIATHPPLNGAAWVRVASVEPLPNARDLITRLWGNLRDDLVDSGARMVCWLATERWIVGYLPMLGFAYHDEIVTLRRIGDDLPPAPRPPGLRLRPIDQSDLPDLVAIDHAAFVPPWQNVADDIRQSWRASASATLAQFDGQAVGYQISTFNQQKAHLARLAVCPQVQGRGVGAALVTEVITHFLRRRVRALTVNTQATNAQSLRLYQRFHFARNGYNLPVWVHLL